MREERGNRSKDLEAHFEKESMAEEDGQRN
jgi:hypothetical protein